MDKSYVEQREGAYFVKGTRVSLDSVTYAFLDGFSPETMATDFYPVLSLEEIYGAIAYYLAHRDAIDRYSREGEAEYEKLREESRKADPEFYGKLMAAKRKMETSRL